MQRFIEKAHKISLVGSIIGTFIFPFVSPAVKCLRGETLSFGFPMEFIRVYIFNNIKSHSNWLIYYIMYVIKERKLAGIFSGLDINLIGMFIDFIILYFAIYGVLYCFANTINKTKYSKK